MVGAGADGLPGCGQGDGHLKRGVAVVADDGAFGEAEEHVVGLVEFHRILIVGDAYLGCGLAFGELDGGGEGEYLAVGFAHEVVGDLRGLAETRHRYLKGVGLAVERDFESVVGGEVDTGRLRSEHGVVIVGAGGEACGERDGEDAVSEEFHFVRL